MNMAALPTGEITALACSLLTDGLVHGCPLPADLGRLCGQMPPPFAASQHALLIEANVQHASSVIDLDRNMIAILHARGSLSDLSHLSLV